MSEEKETVFVGGPAHGLTEKLPFWMTELEVPVIGSLGVDDLDEERTIKPFRYAAQIFRCHTNVPYQYEDIRVMAPQGWTHADTFKALIEAVKKGGFDE